MRYNCITTLENAWSIAEPWGALAARDPLLSPEWLLTWWKHYGQSAQLSILHSQDDAGNTIGIAPLFCSDQFLRHKLECLGSGRVCSDYMRFLCQPEDSLKVANLFAEAAISLCRNKSVIQSSELVLEGIELNSRWHSDIEKAFGRLGYSQWYHPLESSFRLKLPATFGEYLNQLSSSAKRKAKKLIAKLDNGSLAYFQTSRIDEIASRMGALQRLHQSRRRTLGQPGCYSDERFTRFINEAVGLLAEKNQVSLQWCEHESKPISIHLLLYGTDTTYMYQSGADPEFMETEPGHTLTISAIRQTIKEGFAHYDFLRGEEKYKSYWGGVPVPMVTLRCSPPDTVSRMVGFSHERLWKLKQRSKGFAKLIRALGSTTSSSERGETQLAEAKGNLTN